MTVVNKDLLGYNYKGLLGYKYIENNYMLPAEARKQKCQNVHASPISGEPLSFLVWYV